MERLFFLGAKRLLLLSGRQSRTWCGWTQWDFIIRSGTHAGKRRILRISRVAAGVLPDVLCFGRKMTQYSIWKADRIWFLWGNRWKNIISDSGCHQKTNGLRCANLHLFIRRCRFERGLCGLCRRVKETGKKLTTFSFDFIDNDKYFKANSFQPSQDRPYVDKMVSFLDSDHHYLECDNKMQADLLYRSVDAHDLPCMADIDSSLQYFCEEVSHSHKVVLTGECADEVFGGYPWFHREEMLNSGTFPWTPSLTPRKVLLKDDLVKSLHMDEYVKKFMTGQSVKSMFSHPKMKLRQTDGGLVI